MSAPPYMKLFWADYHQDTRHLSRSEHGAYFLLIGEAWNRGGYLPDDDTLLARWTLSTPREWATLKPIIMAFFVQSGSRWKHKRITEELSAYAAVSRKRKEAGKRGGSASRGKGEENPKANAGAIAPQKPTKPEPEPEEGKTPLAPQGGQDEQGQDDAAPSDRRKRSRPIPDDFPNADDVSKAQMQARVSGKDADMAYHAERFRSWALGKDARYVDWGQTWANWVRRTIKEAPAAKGVRPAQAAAKTDPSDRWRRPMRAFKANQYWNTTDDGPRPGKPGCQVPHAILAEFGMAPEGADLLPFDPTRSAA